MHKVLVLEGIYLEDIFYIIESEDRYFIGDEEIQNDKQYTLGTVDMYTFGRYFPLLKGLSTDYIMPEFLRDIFKEKLLKL